MAIVVSHAGDAFDAIARRAVRQRGLADLVELRLDGVGHPGADALRRVCAEVGKPVIVACPGPEAGGRFAGSIDERLQLLVDAAEAGARFVDVPWELSLELGEVAGRCHRIVSRHDTEGVPDDLPAWHEEVAAVLYEGDVTKLVPTARTCEDGWRVLRWLRTTKGLVAFCMGEAGRFTRVLAPIFGSPFTYCAPAAVPGEPAPPATAPGQLRVDEMLGLLPPGGASQETAVLAVVGRPVGHSASPRVHGMALKAARLDAVYVALEPESLEGLLALADDRNLRGLSVTAPFKQAAVALAATRDAASSACGAANTLVRERDGWRAANTDAPAVRETLTRAFELRAKHGLGAASPEGAVVLVLGAGGAARAAAYAAGGLGCRVVVAGRDLERARAAAEATGAEARAWSDAPTVPYDALVHCTPLGSPSHPGELPLPADALRAGAVVLDAVYRPVRTPLLVAARERGCVAVPGAEWFWRQAAAQYRLFTGADPDEALLRAALEHALDERPEAET